MLAYLFLLVAIAARFGIALHLLPGVFQFTPVAAALLYFGARMPRKQLWVPVALFGLSDLLLSRVVYGYQVGLTELVSLAWYAALVLLAGLLAGNSSSMRLVPASLLASVSFFVISNFVVWAQWTTYPHTTAGLVECYAMALPFFRNALAGDLAFTLVFFGLGAALHADEGVKQRA
jgi:hypothetical protein